MPTYDYNCSSCEKTYELFESVMEHMEGITPHCPLCDPEEENSTTMERFMGNNSSVFKIGGKGVFRPGVF